jgi:type II secretory ATPase GspE/PulE/Tfp pilus assembly ATPase PilB-like protein
VTTANKTLKKANEMQEADDENKRKTISIVITNLLNNSILKALHNGMSDLHINLHQIST